VCVEVEFVQRVIMWKPNGMVLILNVLVVLMGSKTGMKRILIVVDPTVLDVPGIKSVESMRLHIGIRRTKIIGKVPVKGVPHLVYATTIVTQVQPASIKKATSTAATVG